MLNINKIAIWMVVIFSVHRDCHYLPITSLFRRKRCIVFQVWPCLIEAMPIYCHWLQTCSSGYVHMILWSYLSVTLRYLDDRGRNSSKIISRSVRLVCSFSADLNITDLLQWEHSKNFGLNRVRLLKKWLLHTTALISLKCGKIPLWLLLRTNRKSYTRFRLVPKSTVFTLFQNTCAMVLLFFVFSFTFSLL